MFKSNFTVKLVISFLVVICSFTAAFAQAEMKASPAETNYEITLHLVAASKNAGEKTPVPQSLAGVIKKLKETYSNSNYYLSSTYFQRVANGGNFEFKGLSPSLVQNQSVLAPTFSEWTVGQILSNPEGHMADAIQLKNFRFGQRIPVNTGELKDEGSKRVPIVSYENIMLSMQKINLAENTPTILGNFSGSSTDEVMFLIITVKPAQN